MAYENKFGAGKNEQISQEGRKHRDNMMLLYAYQGKTQDQIAQLCNCSKSLVAQKLPALLDAESRKNGKLIAREITLQLGRLDLMFNMAMDQFTKSCETSLEVEKTDEGYVDQKNQMGVVEGVTTKGSMAQPRRTVRTTHKQNVGDPRFLAEARQIMERRAKLLGIDQEEIRQVVVNQFIKNEVNLNAQMGQQVDISIEEMKEMASIMSSLGLQVGGVPNLPEALPPPQEAEEDVIDGDFSYSAIVASEREAQSAERNQASEVLRVLPEVA